MRPSELLFSSDDSDLTRDQDFSKFFERPPKLEFNKNPTTKKFRKNLPKNYFSEKFFLFLQEVPSKEFLSIFRKIRKKIAS